MLNVCERLWVDEALMINWLGPSREYFFDASECIQKKIGTTRIKWLACSSVVSITLTDRADLEFQGFKAKLDELPGVIQSIADWGISAHEAYTVVLQIK